MEWLKTGHLKVASPKSRLILALNTSRSDMNEETGVVSRMHRQVKQWEAAGDHRAIFLSCYAMMTENMLKAIESGRFRDGPWVSALLHRFADYYFDALECYDCGDKVPEAWRQVYEATLHQKLHVLQHLLLGVNAHINYDLVLTLYEMLRAEWPSLSTEGRQRRRADHLMVNQVIAETIDQVQDEVVERYDPFMDIIDRLLGRMDERFLSALVSNWRGEVWENVLGMLACRSAEEREELRRKVEAGVLHKASWINPRL